MKKTIFIISIMLLFIVTSCSSTKNITNKYLKFRYEQLVKWDSNRLEDQSSRYKDGWTLVFEENFQKERWNSQGDESHWKIGGSNIYHPNRLNVWYGEPELLENGFAAFTARYNPKEIYAYQLDSIIEFPYEVSKLFSYNFFEQQYGRFECRMTLPHAKHSWPAFWLWGPPWPPEIDIIEAYGRKTGDDVIYQEINLHWGERSNPKQMGAWKIKIDNPENIGINFYEFAIEWSENRIDFFTNGVRVFTFRDKNVLNEWFNQPMWVVINNNIRHAGVEELGEEYYSEFLVDYIRVYKHKK